MNNAQFSSQIQEQMSPLQRLTDENISQISPIISNSNFPNFSPAKRRQKTDENFGNILSKKTTKHKKSGSTGGELQQHFDFSNKQESLGPMQSEEPYDVIFFTRISLIFFVSSFRVFRLENIIILTSGTIYLPRMISPKT